MARSLYLSLVASHSRKITGEHLSGMIYLNISGKLSQSETVMISDLSQIKFLFTPLQPDFPQQPSLCCCNLPSLCILCHLRCFPDIAQSHISAPLFLAFCSLSHSSLHFLLQYLHLFASEQGHKSKQALAVPVLTDISWHHGTVLHCPGGSSWLYESTGITCPR